MNEKAMVGSGPDVECGIAICPACEEDLVARGEKFCHWCCLLREALEERYGRRSAMFAAQPREDAGVLTIEEAKEPLELIRADPKMQHLVAAGFVFFGFGLALFSVIGWYGIRFFCWAGIQLADWLTR